MPYYEYLKVSNKITLLHKRKVYKGVYLRLFLRYTMPYESYFDAKIRKVGNSKVITIPIETIEKLELEEKMIIEVGIKRSKKK